MMTVHRGIRLADTTGTLHQIWTFTVLSDLWAFLLEILSFFKRNVVMTIAMAAAALTCLIVPVDQAYMGYFDLKTLSCLFCVLAVVCALKEVNFFYLLAAKIVQCFKSSGWEFLVTCFRDENPVFRFINIRIILAMCAQGTPY